MMTIRQAAALWGLAGLLGGAGAGLGIRAHAQEAPLIHPTVTGGRYQIFYSPIARSDTFLVDTGTGATWQMIQDPTTQKTFFQPCHVLAPKLPDGQ